MQECLQERKHRGLITVNNSAALRAHIHIAGAPDGISKFRTRVVMNEVLQGASLGQAIDKALSISSKKEG